MTKRFWILNTLTKCSGIKDKDKLLTFDEVVDLLNTLHEENEQLKQKNGNLIKISAMTQVRNDRLKEENEQLKEENRKLRLENGKLTHDLFWANKRVEELKR